MSSQPTTARRKSPPAVVGFDDQLWPVNVLLLLLASFVAGLIVAQGDFRTSDPLRNGYVHLAVVGWLALLLSMASAFLGRVVQHRIQIAVLLSLLVHLGVCWGMREYHLPVVQPDLLAKTEPATLPPLATLPEYRVRVPAERVVTEKKEEFEKPLATDLPDTDLPDMARQAAPAAKRRLPGRKNRRSWPRCSPNQSMWRGPKFRPRAVRNDCPAPNAAASNRPALPRPISFRWQNSPQPKPSARAAPTRPTTCAANRPSWLETTAVGPTRRSISRPLRRTARTATACRSKARVGQHGTIGAARGLRRICQPRFRSAPN